MSDDIQYEMASREAFRDNGTTTSVMSALGVKLLREFSTAEEDRYATELRWLQDLRQFKGQYDPEVLAAIGPKRSRAFVRKTRVKVKTANSRVEDLLFPAGSEKNWEVDTTPVPTVSDDVRKGVIKQLQQMAQQAAQQGQKMPAPYISKKMVDDAVLKLCKESAKGMAKVIDDQLSEVRYKQICKKVVNSGHLFGTGILKGPLVERRIRSKFVQEKGKWVEKSESYVVPFVDFVPLWRFYPDMGADSLDNCRYIYERHQMTHTDLAELAQRKSFRKDIIVEYLRSHPNGECTVKFIDGELKSIGDRQSKQGDNDGRYEVLERWGYVSGEDLRSAGLEVADDRSHESFFSNIWMLPNGEVVKAVLQPINGVTWPYHVYYFDKDETSFFGEGLASVMRDDQTMMNAATRLMLDNGAITSGAMIEVATGLLSSMEEGTEIEPWKVFLRNSTSPGTPAVRAIELPSRLGDLSGLADRFENNADEVSAIPRYMTGENVASGAGGTASGMSMLMGAANIMIKDLVSNWDEGITRSFITGMYRWNMQFHPDAAIKGDFDVKARGSSSLVAREVRAQQLDAFSLAVANPMDAPFIKRDHLLRQRAEAHELSDVIKTEEEVMAEQNNEQAAQQQQIQQAQMQLTMAELQQKVALLTAQAAKAMAEVELVKARATETKVGSVFAALQAGGAATQNPHVAPAGDEILRSAGWVDATPNPSIAQISGQPVQEQPVFDPTKELDKPDSGRVGLNAGMETAVMNDN